MKRSDTRNLSTVRFVRRLCPTSQVEPSTVVDCLRQLAHSDLAERFDPDVALWAYPRADIRVRPDSPIGSSRCSLACVVCCRVQPSPVETIRVQLDRGGCMRRLSEVRETWKTAFADPLCARTAACRDRDKPANLYSDRGGKWRSLNPAFPYFLPRSCIGTRG